MTEELPPYNFIKDNLVHGISADILLQLLEKNDISIDRGSIQLFPWPRAYQMVQDIPGSILFSTARTSQREKLFKWVGPITDLTMGLVGLKTKNIKLQSIKDADKYRIGTIREVLRSSLSLRLEFRKVIWKGLPARKQILKNSTLAGSICLLSVCPVQGI